MQPTWLPVCALSAALLFFPETSLAECSRRIYVDADRTHSRESGVSIERGIRTALAEAGSEIGGCRVEIAVKDHRGSSPRSRRHLESFLEDDDALLVFSGLHSAPLLANRDFINEREILVLDPWAAAGPITRYPKTANWIFRLSVDDEHAGFFIADHAIREGFSRPHLILEETTWGRSHERHMKRALLEHGVEPVGTSWFEWNLGEPNAHHILADVVRSGADVVFLVANAPEGKSFARAMAELPEPQRTPIRSHWGITGGNFPSAVPLHLRERIDLEFVQTRFSFVSHRDDPLGKEVLARARELFHDIEVPEDIKAPAGFIHAHDLTLLLLAAADTVDWTGDAKTDRRALRDAFERIDGPVRGLVKSYRRPFGPWTANRPDAHEALGIEDLVMARYGEEGEIVLTSPLVAEARR